MNKFYEWSTPNIKETRIMEYLTSQEDNYQLVDNIINKLCNIRIKANGTRFHTCDNAILEHIYSKMKNVSTWDKHKIYNVCSSVKYRHINALIYAIKNRRIRDAFNTAAETTKGKALDIGCLDENLTRYVCMKLDNGFMHDKIDEQHGIDVKEWQGENRHIVDEKGFVYFTEIDTEYSRYPYPDNNFFFITCFQVLHHVENPTFILSEIYRVIAPGGYVIIKEHDIINQNVASLCYVSHIIRKYLISDVQELGSPNPDYPIIKCWFKNRHTWDKLFHRAGFNIISYYYQPNNTIGTYYTLLQK